jgi:formate-dependent nitrite reductase membrane component NrfD
MWDILLGLFTFLEPIGWFLAYLYDLDDRPEARKVTIGCGVIVLLIAVVVGLLLALR